MLRRVSPEGRALAHRQRLERQRRTTRQVGLCMLLAIILLAAIYAISLAGVPVGSGVLGLAAIIFLAGCIAVFLHTRPTRLSVTELHAVPLPAIPQRVGEWLEQQRKSLPAPALPIIDDLSRQLSSFGPQLAALDPNGPGSMAVRKLVAIELPELIERYRNIPASAAPEAAAQLVQGLEIIDGEIGRVSRDLASGSFDALATQNRYLQLKYDAGLGGT